jgi:hypothetical protein
MNSEGLVSKIPIASFNAVLTLTLPSDLALSPAHSTMGYLPDDNTFPGGRDLAVDLHTDDNTDTVGATT